jgi:hypothetical protein
LEKPWGIICLLFGDFPNPSEFLARACQHLGKRVDVSADDHRGKLAAAVTSSFFSDMKENNSGIGSALNAASNRDLCTQ